MPDGQEQNQPLSLLDQDLHGLIQQGMDCEPNSPQRRKLRQRIAWLMQQSGKIWDSPEPYYEDALMQTWRYFFANLWVATTAETAFCEADCHIMARFNTYLRFRLKDAGIAQTEERKQRARARDSDSDAVDIAEQIPAPQPAEDEQAAQVREVIETDPTGELRQTHVRGREDITAQLLLMRRGLEDTDWKVLAAELNSRISTLSGFYQNKCLPLIRRLFNAPPP